MHRWVDHTAELELEIEAESEQGVFEEALVALGGLLAERADEEEDRRRARSPRGRRQCPGPSHPGRRVASELAYLAETDGFVPHAVERLELSDDALEATVVGRHGSPPHLVKAVTYHRLGMWEEDETWRARVIFDV